MSNPSVAVQNFDLGPAQIFYNGTDLGGTLKNVTVKPKYMKADMKADQFGQSVLNRVVSGMDVQIETEIAEVLDPTKWKIVFPHADLITSGMNNAIAFRNKVGIDDLSLAQLLVIHPLNRGASDKTSDYNFFKALAAEESQFVYGPTEQIALKIVWNVYLDTSVQPARLFSRGDPSILPVAASAGSPTAGSNTGNGTITSVTTGSKTVTETITLTCMGAPAANKSNWYVSGSITGPIGIVDVTSGAPSGSANFTSNYINFTVTDGSVDFIAGDTFTIATTAPNYV